MQLICMFLACCAWFHQHITVQAHGDMEFPEMRQNFFAGNTSFGRDSKENSPIPQNANLNFPHFLVLKGFQAKEPNKEEEETLQKHQNVK